MTLSPSHLDAYVAEELEPEVAAQTRAHLEVCECCRREVRLLETERALFRARRAVVPVPRPVLETVQRQLTARARSRARTFAIVFAAVAAVAVMSLTLAPRAAPPPWRGPMIPVASTCGVSACCDRIEELIALLDQQQMTCLVSMPPSREL